MVRDQDVDDVIQEAYCRLAAMDDVTHVGNGRAYLFQTSRNIVLEQVRRSKIVRFENLADLGSLNVVDDAPPIERVLSGAKELQRVAQLIEQLPARCREVFVLRRVHGVSQREIAKTLGVTEAAVEKHAARGLKSILGWLERDDEIDKIEGAKGGRARDRSQNC
jgi:RNA polymerase sigma-70 factor (ECF subfamily)